MADNETAFVLPAKAVAGSDTPVHFANFPGVWYPEQPISVSALGFATLKDARAAREALAPDLKETKVAEGSAEMPAVANHVPLADTAAPDADETVTPAEQPNVSELQEGTGS